MVTGPEEFFKRDVVKLLIDRVAGSEKGADFFTESAPSSPKDIFDTLVDLRTPSFLSPLRVVYLRSCDKFIKDADSELARALTEGLPCGYLVLECSKLPARSSFVAEARKRESIIDCRRLWDTPPSWRRDLPYYETELHKWVVEHAGRLGVKFSLPLAGELVALTGNSPGVIDQELRKLRDRVGSDRRPTPEDIAALVPDRRRDSVFRVVDAALLGKTRTAFSGVRRLMQFGYRYGEQQVNDPATIATLTIGALAGRLRTLRRAAPFFRNNPDPNALVTAGLVPRPAAAVVAEELRRLDERAVERGVAILLETDRRLKGRFGKADPALLLESAVLRLSRLGR